MNWIALDTEEKLNELTEKSKNSRVLIFKFKPRDIISILIRGLLERYWHSGEMEMELFFLNVAEQPDLSDKVDSIFGLKTDIPSILIIENKKCIYTASSGQIDYNKIRAFSNLYKNLS